MRKKFFRRFTAAALAFNVLNFSPNFYIFNPMSVACAQVETYEGVGEYIMSKKETPEFAEKAAKEYALRNAQEKAGFFLKSSSIVKNNNLEDEIIVIAANIVREVETVPELIPLSGADKGYIKCRVTVKVQIDTDELKTEIDKLLKRDSKEVADLVEKNKVLQKMLDEANKRNADLEKLIANAKTSDDKKIIDSEAAMVTNDAQVIEKVTEGNKYLYKNNQNAAKKIYDESIKDKIYEGKGVHIMSEDETFGNAQKLAQKKAMEDARKKAAIYLQEHTNNFSHEEIQEIVSYLLTDEEIYALRSIEKEDLEMVCIVKLKFNNNKFDEILNSKK